jgi:hypothetical protein
MSADNPSAFPSGLKATNIGSNGGRYEGTYVDEYAPACSKHGVDIEKAVAMASYAMADAMLKARAAA